MKRNLIATLLVMAVGTTVYAGNQSLPELQSVYQQSVEKIENGYQNNLKAALDAYAQALPQAEMTLKRAGDLDGVVAVKAEKARFSRDNTVPNDTPKDLPSVIARLQKRYLSNLSAIEGQKNKETAALIRSYTPHLNVLKKRLLMADQIADARAVDSEIKRVSFTLADAESRIPSTMTRGSAGTGATPAHSSLLSGSLAKGCLLHYDFDQDEGEKITDRSGKGHHGKVLGGDWESNGRGLGNGTYEFNGKDEMIDIGDQVKPVLPITVAVWVNIKELDRGADVFMNDEFIMGKQYAGISVGCQAKTGRIFARMGAHQMSPSGRKEKQAAEGALSVGEWHHVAVVWEAYDNIQIYLDGEARDGVYSGNAWKLVYTDAHGRVGGFRGSVDELLVYDRALSGDEIGKLYAQQGGR